MWNLRKFVFLVCAGLVISSPASGDQTTYSDQFVQGVPYFYRNSQYADWLSYRASLPTSDVTSITVSGSLDHDGRTCSDPEKAQQIVDAMRAGVSALSPKFTLTLICDDFTWNTGRCGADRGDSNNLELNVGTRVLMCSCGTSNHTLRPGIFNYNWGGIAGATCRAQNQTITVTVNFGADTDTDGVIDADDLCADTAPGDWVDGVGCSDAQVDADGDTVCDLDAASGGPSECTGIDACADTVIPEAIVPTFHLKPNHWALTSNGDLDVDFKLFNTMKSKSKGAGRSYSVGNTHGCSCEQIIEAQGLGKGQIKHGCSSGAMDDWLELMQ